MGSISECNLDINALETIVEGIVEEWIFNVLFPETDDDNIFYDVESFEEVDTSSESSGEDESDDDEPLYSAKRPCIRNNIETEKITIHFYSKAALEKKVLLRQEHANNMIEKLKEKITLKRNKFHTVSKDRKKLQEKKIDLMNQDLDLKQRKLSMDEKTWELIKKYIDIRFNGGNS